MPADSIQRKVRRMDNMPQHTTKPLISILSSLEIYIPGSMVSQVVPTKYTWNGIQNSNVRCKFCQIYGGQPPIHESHNQPAQDSGRTQEHNNIEATPIKRPLEILPEPPICLPKEDAHPRPGRPIVGRHSLRSC